MQYWGYNLRIRVAQHPAAQLQLVPHFTPILSSLFAVFVTCGFSASILC